MKQKLFIYLMLMLMVSTATWAQNNSMKMDSFSYALGVLIGGNLKNQGIEKFSPADLVQALEDVMANKTKMNSAQAQKAMQEGMAPLMAAKEAKAAAAGNENKMQGEKFLAENGKRAGVTTLPSGLQYEVMKMGTGAKPGPSSKVKTHYHGTLINGTVFDSSVERGEPISFPVNGVIKGWTEALQLMPVGSKWKLFIPYNLAYGERGAGGDIGPYATLIFEVELLGIE